MANIDRIRVSWTGFVGAPGVSTFYADAAPTMLSALHAFFVSIAGIMPADVRISIPGSGDTLDSTTGVIVGSWTGVAPAVVSGSSPAGYNAAAGILLQWATGTILSGRRLRGHTFIVPAGGDQYDVSGQVTNGVVAAVNTYIATLVAASAGNWILYQRPRVATPAWTDRTGHVHAALSGRGGGYGPVTSGQARHVVTELKSRRD